jgi:hypothetical protein
MFHLVSSVGRLISVRALAYRSNAGRSSGCLPIHADNENGIYNAGSIAGVDIAKIVYFCVSVFWRAAVSQLSLLNL